LKDLTAFHAASSGDVEHQGTRRSCEVSADDMNTMTAGECGKAVDHAVEVCARERRRQRQ